MDEEPYRLYTSDHFDDRYNFHSIYGAVPILHAKSERSKSVASLLWANSSDTFVDIFSTPEGRNVHWMSESGALEFYLFLSVTPEVMSFKQRALSGESPLPPLFSLGYHQCRWNYMSQQETLEVSNLMS